MEIEIAKIVGAINDKSWSQVHSFKPEGEKLRTHGQLVAALAFKAKRELEVASFGTEIITRLQETYYSNESKSLLKKLTQTMESLAAEFLEAVELEIVMVVVWRVEEKNVLYVGRSGGGQVYLARGEKLVSLLIGEKHELTAVSGELEPGDRLLLGTDQFFEIVPEGAVGPALDQGKASQIMESLAPVVHGHEKSSRVAAVIVRSQKPEVETQVELEEETKEEEGEEEGREEEREKAEKEMGEEDRYIGREQKVKKQGWGRLIRGGWEKGKGLIDQGWRKINQRLRKRGGAVYVS